MQFFKSEFFEFVNKDLVLLTFNRQGEKFIQLKVHHLMFKKLKV